MTVESAPRNDGEGAGVIAQDGWVARVGTDWWAVVLVGVVTALAVADVLPKIPW